MQDMQEEWEEGGMDDTSGSTSGSTVAQRVAGLNHETLDHTVEDHPVVIPGIAQGVIHQPTCIDLHSDRSSAAMSVGRSGDGWVVTHYGSESRSSHKSWVSLARRA